MDPIPIAYVIDEIDSSTAGTEKQLLSLITNIDRNSFRPILCCLRGLGRPVVSVHKYNMDIRSFHNLRSWKNIGRLSRILSLEGVKIVQTFFRDANIVGTLAGSLARVPVIISSRRNRGYWHNSYEIFLVKFINSFCTSFVTNSEEVRRYTHIAESVPLERIKVIHNGFDFTALRSVESRVPSIRHALAIPGDSLVGVCVANLRPIKGIDVLLMSVPAILQQVPKFRLLLVGDGIERRKLEDLSESLRIRDFIHFLGKRNDVLSILSECDVGVLASHSESLSNSVLEYMAMSLPVVVTDVGGTREMVGHGRNGFLVSPGDPEALSSSVVKILQDEDVRRKMGARSRVLAEERFSMKRCINEYEKYYMRLLFARGIPRSRLFDLFT